MFKAKIGKDNEEKSDHARNDGAGMVELDVERQQSDGEQHERHVGIHEEGEDLLLDRHVEIAHRLVCQVQRDLLAVEARDLAAIELLQQVFLAGGDHVNQVVLERFLVGEGLGLAHGALGDLDVAAALGDHRAHEGGGIVLDFFRHDLVGLAAAERDRMRRAGVGAGRHGGDVGGFQDEEPGRGGARAAGRDVDDDRHGRSDDLLDDLARRFGQAAGRRKADQDGVGVLRLGGFDAAGDVFQRDGVNGVVDVEAENVACVSRACRRHEHREREQGNEE